MPSGSQDLEWFMCAGMLREEDLRLEESKRPSFRIDLLSKQITKRAGIWWRESLLKGTVSFIFPGGLLRLDVQFRKELGWDLLFSSWFSARKVPIATCTACLTVISGVYRVAVNHPLSFVLSSQCIKNNSVKFCVYVEMKIVCLTLHSDSLMFLVPVNAITAAAAAWVLSCRL